MSYHRTQVEVLNFGSGYIEFWIAGKRDSLCVPIGDIPYYIRKNMIKGSIHYAKFDHNDLTFTDWEITQC